LDVWVNNSGVTLFSRFKEAPMEEYRRVFKKNPSEYVYGAPAALPRGNGSPLAPAQNLFDC
jgi:NADP-dependent 3-hydroxy acid dehydrogenase YdfG